MKKLIGLLVIVGLLALGLSVADAGHKVGSHNPTMCLDCHYIHLTTIDEDDGAGGTIKVAQTNFPGLPLLYKLDEVIPVWIPYQSETLITVLGGLDPYDEFCLKCHSADHFAGHAYLGDIYVDGDGMKHHPTSFVYDDALVAASAARMPPDILNPPAAVGTQLYLTGPGSDRVNCVTCHDAHGGAGIDNYLRIAYDEGTGAGNGGLLCGVCHVGKYNSLLGSH